MKKYLHLLLSLIFIVPSLCRTQNPTLYGMTSDNGTLRHGTLFKINASNKETVLHNFGSGTDASEPWGSLIRASNGLLYGMSIYGGVYDGGGTIFSYNISADTIMVLHSFGNDTDGKWPVSSFIQASNNLLYGMTEWGGAHNLGAIISYNILTGKDSVLHSFKGYPGDGSGPVYGSLIQVNDSLLYGMTSTGGSVNVDLYFEGGGTIFSYNIYTGKYTILYSFGNGTDGYWPYGSLMRAGNGLFYGMTGDGGTYDYGTIFSYNSSKNTETVLYNFGTSSPHDGQLPFGSLLQASDSLLYGMTEFGGADTDGIIFSYNITKDTEIVLHNFTGADGAEPYGSLIQANNNLLYGMTSYGGANLYDGTIFTFNNSNGDYIDVHDFGNISDSDGAVPYGDLLEVDSTATDINRLSVNTNQLSIYPNPSSDFIHINIQLNQSSNLQLRLVNMLGQTMWSADAGNVARYQNGISVANLPDGVYLLEMVTGGGMETKEIVVAR